MCGAKLTRILRDSDSDTLNIYLSSADRLKCARSTPLREVCYRCGDRQRSENGVTQSILGCTTNYYLLLRDVEEAIRMRIRPYDDLRWPANSLYVQE